MPTRSANATWNGGLKGGTGRMALGSGAFQGGFSFSTRFEEEPGTNPEELIGAALAGCFSMALSGQLEKAGHPPKRVSTSAKVILEMLDGGPTITRIELTTEADVPGIDESTFQETAEGAKKNCPVSRALAVPEIVLEASLVG